MKIRILRHIETVKGKIEPGTILDVTPRVAEDWVANRDAAYVSKPEASENKVIKPSENKSKSKSRKREDQNGIYQTIQGS